MPPAIVALLLQIAAVVGLLFVARALSVTLTPARFAVGCGLAASGLSYMLGMARWWLIIQSLFVPALVATMALDIDPRVFFAAFLATALVFWNVLTAQVPLYLSSTAVWRALESLLPPPSPQHNLKFIDVGSGLGGVIMHLAAARPDIDCTGIESAPLPFLWSWVRVRGHRRRNCNVHWGNFWDNDLSGFDVVYAYLSPAPMEKLWQKACAEMKPGTLFISSSFNVPGETPAQTIQVDDLHQTKLLIWQM